jgi:hypothetical protein
LIYQGNVNQAQNINIAGGTFQVQNGITDLGQSTINVSPKQFTAGLLEGRIAANSLGGFSGTAPNTGVGRPDTDTGGIRLSPRMGLTGRTGGGNYWGNDETWVYTGEFFDADGRFAFAESIDDAVRVKIDGVQVLANDQWQTATSTGRTDGLVTNNGDGALVVGNLRPGANGSADADNNYGMGPAGDGWHTIEIRFANGGGGAGALGDTNATGWGGGDNDSYTRKGFGLMSDLVLVPSPEEGQPPVVSLNGNDYALPIEPGLESGPTLFRVATAGTGGRVDIGTGSTLRAGSITGADLVSFSGAGRLELSANGAVSSRVDTISSLGDNNGLGVILVGESDTLTVGSLQLPGGGLNTFEKAGPGTLIISGSLAGSAAGTTPSNLRTDALNVTAGTLLVNSTLRADIEAGSALGAGRVTVTGATSRIGGTGTLGGPLTVNNGGTVAPGELVGTLTTGDLTLSGGRLEIQLNNANAHDILRVNGTVNLTNSSLVTSLLSTSGGAVGDIFYILINDLSDPIQGTFNGMANGSSFVQNGNTYSISYFANFADDIAARSLTGGNDIALQLMAIPEPTTFASLASGIGLLMGLRRFRRRS